jgi:hypothetical protein
LFLIRDKSNMGRGRGVEGSVEREGEGEAKMQEKGEV